MRGLYLSLGALALGVVNAHQYPVCETDNCYRNLIDSRFADEANTFCVDYLSGTTTAPSAIPTDFNNCNDDVAAVSSACSCVTYALTATSTSSATTTTPESTSTAAPATTTSSPGSSSSVASTTSSSVPTTTGTAHPITSSNSSTTYPPTSSQSSAPSSSAYNNATSQSMTISTIYTTSVYTVTSCAPTVTNCPAKMGQVTTETIVIGTTVCPVSTPIMTTSILYKTSVYTVTACPETVTNCPAKMGNLTTETIIIGTTVCPVSVTTEYPSLTTVAYTTPKPTSIGTIIPVISKTTVSPAKFTAAAGRVSTGFEMMAAAAAIFVAFL